MGHIEIECGSRNEEALLKRFLLYMHAGYYTSRASHPLEGRYGFGDVSLAGLEHTTLHLYERKIVSLRSLAEERRVAAERAGPGAGERGAHAELLRRRRRPRGGRGGRQGGQDRRGRA